ncbi:MAG: DUF2788 domain-containing protein [Oleiphilaceae bacterium]|nr:DUF2788 domain-containing protein [Oleiphilaceae bacterium]
MTLAQFEELSLYVGIGGLILYMAYIVWDLAKRSNAGKFGTAMLFLVLGLGVFGFVAKSVIAEIIGI